MSVKNTASLSRIQDADRSSRRRALVAHPYWGRGGAEAAAMWVLSTLGEDFDVTVLTRGGFDLTELNRLAGTSLSEGMVAVRCVSQPRFPTPSRLRHMHFLSEVRDLSGEYDLLVTASGNIDFGRPAIHFLSSLAWHPTLNTRYFTGRRGPDTGIFRHIIRRFLDKIFPFPVSALSGDLLIANSHWTAAASEEFARGKIAVIHPPIGLARSEADVWRSDKSTFERRILCFGRVSPEKRIEDCIDVIARVHQLGGDHYGLDVAGKVESPLYRTFLQRRAASSGVTLTFLGEVKDSKSQFLSQYRYGISCCEVEAFGIATAEMCSAGVVVVAPECSAQSEILRETRQLYEDLEDAAQKLFRIVSSASEREHLSDNARRRSSAFSASAFSLAVRREVRLFLNDRELSAPPSR